MNPKGLKHIFRRVQFWPAAAQQEALRSLRAIEADLFEDDPVSPHEDASLPAPEHEFN